MWKKINCGIHLHSNLHIFHMSMYSKTKLENPVGFNYREWNRIEGYCPICQDFLTAVKSENSKWLLPTCLTFIAAEQGDSTQICVQIFKFKYQSSSDVIFLTFRMAWIVIGCKHEWTYVLQKWEVDIGPLLWPSTSTSRAECDGDGFRVD